MPNLVLLAGIPGCGKTTFAKTYFDLKYAVVSSDGIRRELFGTLKEAHAGHTEGHKPKNKDVFDLFYKRIGDYLAHGVDVIADATFLTRASREEAIAVGWDQGAKIHLILFKNIMEATVRNAGRATDDIVPEDVMQHMSGKYYNSLAEIVQESFDSVLKIESFT